MGFDDINAFRVIDYRISVVDRDAREQGREAMRLLQECFESAGGSRQRGKENHDPLPGCAEGIRKIMKERGE